MNDVENDLKELEGDIKDVYRSEYVERELRIAEREAERAKNLLVHREEIYNRPKKEWIVSNKQKALIKEKAKELVEGPSEKKTDKDKKGGKDLKKKLDSSAKGGDRDKDKKKGQVGKKSKNVKRNSNRKLDSKGHKKKGRKGGPSMRKKL